MVNHSLDCSYTSQNHEVNNNYSSENERHISNSVPIFSASFFPPIQYFARLYAAKKILIEAYENYQKKSYHNRYMIYGANGIIPLSVPVEKGVNAKQLIKDVRIAYCSHWNENHWKTLESTYSSSPYFLYYEDEIRKIFMHKHIFLFDLNIASIVAVEKCLEIKTDIHLTKKYYPAGYYENDFRDLIHPKRDNCDDKNLVEVKYHQVFGHKYGFVPNLSILDLLFNKGPETELVLRAMTNYTNVLCATQ